MATELSGAAAQVRPSATLSLKTEIARLEAAYGVRIIDMTAGQPDIGPTPDVLQALAEGGKLHKYGPVPGETGLRAVIAECVNAETCASFTPEQIILTVGAKGAIDTVMRAILDLGDRVVVLSPYWVTYPENVRINGGVPMFARSTADLHPDIDHLAALVRESRPKAIIYSSPSNPKLMRYIASSPSMEKLRPAFSRWPSHTSTRFLSTGHPSGSVCLDGDSASSQALPV